MILYHGSSYRTITKFNFNHSRTKGLDFGKGIYFTTNFEQAKEWSCKYSNKGAVYECELDLSKFNVLSYEDKAEDLIYVLYLCRINLEDVATDTVENFDKADIISGLMLDGNVPNFCEIAEKFNEGDISYEELYNRAKLYENVYNQICIKTEVALEAINANIRKVYYTQKTKNIISEVGVVV